MKSKIETYLGFCVRAGKLAYGVDEIEKKRKGVFLIVFDETLGANSQKVLAQARQNLSCPLMVADEGVLGAYLYKPAVKAVAITDHHLASAIITAAQSEPQFKFYSGGTN
ncbi:MAG: hypothetical protein E7357_01905 [Clostridiales bacterium]|nr:hypothetical protein [Clostridiales bacterium]